MEKFIQEATNNIKRLENQNKVLEEQLRIAIEGLEAIVETCDTLGLSQKTLEEMKKVDDDFLLKTKNR